MGFLATETLGGPRQRWPRLSSPGNVGQWGLTLKGLGPGPGVGRPCVLPDAPAVRARAGSSVPLPRPVKGVRGFRVLSTDYHEAVVDVRLGRAGQTAKMLLLFGRQSTSSFLTMKKFMDICETLKLTNRMAVLPKDGKVVPRGAWARTGPLLAPRPPCGGCRTDPWNLAARLARCRAVHAGAPSQLPAEPAEAARTRMRVLCSVGAVTCTIVGEDVSACRWARLTAGV
ncbi:Epididymal-specific lipocalin-10 [Camelus dromedarius]|uniref:Epididymal-specific lipocalin-10 n=1 Tax=Camelus dromedarius TaxID=9838 RepID=A0A5N4E940_CAMDR|nr:Epididymal-specific lipocalin-10 [Camelus dromedarius]